MNLRRAMFSCSKGCCPARSDDPLLVRETLAAVEVILVDPKNGGTAVNAWILITWLLIRNANSGNEKKGFDKSLTRLLLEERRNAERGLFFIFLLLQPTLLTLNLISLFLTPILMNIVLQ